MNAPIAVKAPEAMVRFTPYGGADEIKLSVKLVQDLIAVKTRSGATCSQRDALKFIAMCQARKLNPYEGDAFLIGYDGKDGPSFSLITAHQAFLKRAELHPEFDGMESGVVVTNGEDGTPTDISGDFHTREQIVVGGWARVHFKNRKVPIYRRLRLERFKKNFGVWVDDPAGMIVKCSEADALRSAFPTMLGGLYLRDEVEINIAPSSKEPDNGSRFQVLAMASDEGHEPHRQQEPEAELTSVASSPAKAEEARPRPSHEILGEMLHEQGFSFDVFVRWAAESGLLTRAEAEAFTTYEELPTAKVDQMLRSLRGAKSRPVILAQMNESKGQPA